jgi:hypothetical protein
LKTAGARIFVGEVFLAPPGLSNPQVVLGSPHTLDVPFEAARLCYLQEQALLGALTPNAAATLDNVTLQITCNSPFSSQYVLNLNDTEFNFVSH